MARLSIIKALAVASAAAILFSCSSNGEEKETPTPNNKEKEEQAYITLSVIIDAGDNTTRADGDPSGGEDGNGRKTGSNNESTVNDATLFIIDQSSVKSYSSNLDPTTSGFDESSLSATIADSYYFNSFTSKTLDNTDGNKLQATYYQSEEKVSELRIKGDKKYYALVVVNMGDMTNYIGKTLQDLIKEARAKTPCDYSSDPTTPTESNNFKMASIAPVTLDSDDGSGTKSDPYKVDVKVERLAARIDFSPSSGSEIKDGDNLVGYAYELEKDDGTKTGNHFVLESVIPFNLPNATMGERLFKTVSTDGSTALAYVMQEAYDDYYATNYVVDGATTAKASSFYDSYHNRVLDDFAPIVTAQEANFKVKEPSTDDDGYYVVNYLMENVPIANDLSFATGIILHGKYYDKSVWDSDNNKPKAEATGEDRNYVYYIRHCNPKSSDESTGKPMYYGIVRNNIYQLKLTKLTERVVTIKLTVKEWTAKKHSAIYI